MKLTIADCIRRKLKFWKVRKQLNRRNRGETLYKWMPLAAALLALVGIPISLAITLKINDINEQHRHHELANRIRQSLEPRLIIIFGSIKYSIDGIKKNFDNSSNVSLLTLKSETLLSEQSMYELTSKEVRKVSKASVGRNLMDDALSKLGRTSLNNDIRIVNSPEEKEQARIALEAYECDVGQAINEIQNNDSTTGFGPLKSQDFQGLNFTNNLLCIGTY